MSNISFSNNANIRFTVNFYNKSGQYVRSLSSVVLSTLDYENFVIQVETMEGVQVKESQISATMDSPTTTVAALIQECKILINKINMTPTSVQPCIQFDIICEKPGAARHGVVLSNDDFNLLKQNDHVFTVLNEESIQAVPNIDYHTLAQWIIDNSITPVPDVPANH